ncbi:transmembrane protein 220 [Centropristis striata]|uniref:transmembrane protein 220 n=1 Tax=Centropristis striata TaxID=184440 RepID=UPI0027E1A0C5|nr:transmembrane protein 220 [Centropristis striata]
MSKYLRSTCRYQTHPSRLNHTIRNGVVGLLSYICTSRRPGRGNESLETTMGEVCKEKSWLSIIWRICNVFMSVFFALATYVQINDPDAGLWMVGYGVPALLCAFIALKPHVTETLPWRRVADLHVMVSSAVVAMLGWRLYKERVTEIFQQEEGREFSGLMLTLVWLLLCRRSGRAPVGMLRVSTAFAITVFPFVAWIYYYINKELRSNWPSHCKTAI